MSDGPPQVVNLRLDTNNLSLIPTALLLELTRIHALYKSGLLVWAHEKDKAAVVPIIIEGDVGDTDTAEEDAIAARKVVTLKGDPFAPPGFEPQGNAAPPPPAAATPEKDPA